MCNFHPKFSESESDKGSEDENLKGDGSSGERHRTKRQAKKLRKRKRVEERRTESVKGTVDEINDHIKRQRVERAVAISQNRVCYNAVDCHLRILYMEHIIYVAILFWFLCRY